MLTDERAVINALVGVLFLTMVAFEFTLLNVCLFGPLFYLMWKMR